MVDDPKAPLPTDCIVIVFISRANCHCRGQMVSARNIYNGHAVPPPWELLHYYVPR